MAIPTLTLGAGFGGATDVPADVGAAREFTVDATTNVLTLADPGTTLPSGAVVKVSSTTTLPAGLAAATEYWLERITDTTCKLHNKPDTDAGTVVDITDTGTGTHTITPDSLTAEVLLQWYWPYTSKRTYDDYVATTTVLLLADHINGIDSVEVSGDDGAWVECGAWEPVTIGGRTYYGYAVNVPTAATDKRVELRARATPLHAGKCRVLQGAVGDFAGTFVPITWQSMWLNSNAGGALPRYFAIVDADNGNDTTGALSTVLATARTTPYATIPEAVKDLGALADGANGALTTSGNTSNIGVTIYLKEAAGISNIYVPGNCTAAIRYNHYALVTIDADPTNTNQVYLRLSGWRNYVRNLCFGNGLIVTPTDAMATSTLVYPDTAAANNFREVVYFEPKEWKDHIVEAFGENWHKCDHLGIGATGGTYTAATRTLTFATEVFAAYTHATNNTIRFSADALAEEQYTIESKTDNYSVVLKATGYYTANAPAGNLTGVATVTNKVRSHYISTQSNAMKQILVRNSRCHHIHSNVVGSFWMVDCEMDRVPHGPQPVQFIDVDCHDWELLTSNAGLHMDVVQFNEAGADGTPFDYNAFVGNVKARIPTGGQPISVAGYTKNVSFFNFLITCEDGETSTLWDWTPNNYADHWLFRNIVSPCHTFRHSDTGITYKNCLVDNSCFKGSTCGSSSVGTVLHRNVILTNEASSAPYSGWGDGNIKVQSPLGYSDLTALATSPNFRPPAGLSLVGSTIIPIDVDRNLRATPTSIGAVAAASELVFTAAATGNWNSGATWGHAGNNVEGSGYPAAGSDVVITGYTVTLTANAACKNITIGASGVLVGGSYTLTVSGNWDSSAGTFTYQTSTVDLTGTGTVTVPGTAYTSYFHNLTCAASSKTTTLASNVGVANVLTLGAGSVAESSSRYIYLMCGSTTPLVNGGATVSVGRLYYRASSGTINVTAGTYTTAMYLYGNAGVTFNLAGTINLGAGLLTLYNASTGTFTVGTANNAMTCGGIVFGASSVAYPVALSLGSSAVTLGASGLVVASNGGSHTLNLGSSTIANAGPWTMVNGTGNITVTPGTSVVTFNATSGTKTITSNSQRFWGLTFAGAGGTFTLADDCWVGGNYTQTAGTITAVGLLVVEGTVTQTGGTLTGAITEGNPYTTPAGAIAADGESLVLTWTREGGWPVDMDVFSTAICTIDVDGTEVQAEVGGIAVVDGETLTVTRYLPSVVYQGQTVTIVAVEAGQAYSEEFSETIRTAAIAEGVAVTNDSEVDAPGGGARPGIGSPFFASRLLNSPLIRG